MLANLKYMVSTEARDEKGCYIKSETKTFDDLGMSGVFHECHFDPYHPFWSKHQEPEKVQNTRIFCALQTNTPGIIAAYNADDVIDHMTNYEVIDEQPMISPRGEVYTHQDFYSMFNEMERIILPSGKQRPEYMNLVGSYGVADNIEQILRKYKSLLNSPDEVVLTIHPVLKKDQPESGGWRWHKWGSYIGNHKIKCEYLYDEVGIDKVLCYNWIYVKPKKGI